MTRARVNRHAHQCNKDQREAMNIVSGMALTMALLFTSPGPVGIVDHGEDGVWALECVYGDAIEFVYIYGDYKEGERVVCPVGGE